MEGQYVRTEGLAGVGQEGMLRVRKASVAIVGMGGLGSAVAPLLVAQGVGHLVLMDDDRVSLSNLPRQLLYKPADVGEPKVERAAERLAAMAPGCRIEAYALRLDADASQCLEGIDVVLDCTDNFDTQYFIDGQMDGATPVVWGAVEHYAGQVALLHGRRGVSLTDLFGALGEPIAPVLPVWPPLVQMVGQVMASEALAWLLGWECALDGSLWMVDMRTYQTQLLRVA